MTITFADIILTVVAMSTVLSIGYFVLSEGKTRRKAEPDVGTPENGGQIIGASRTKVGLQPQQTGHTDQNKSNNRLVVPPEEMEQVFYTREEALLDIDVDIEPNYQLDELEEDEEDLYLLEETESIHSLATGASYDELAEMSEAINTHLHDLSQAHMVRAAKIIEKVENTELFDQFVKQTENGEQQVVAILDSCEAELNGTSTVESENGNVDEFDLGRYL
nr:hypothetical protein [uncultured Draconibacterium sp.]